MNNVRAKFQVQAVTQHVWNKEAVTVTLGAVTDKQNETWAKWTPNGTLEMQINNPAAAEQFKLGAFVYLDFSPAPAAE